jgi:hypothetical protein
MGSSRRAPSMPRTSMVFARGYTSVKWNEADLRRIKTACAIEGQKPGERGRNRTFNLVIKSHLLCQLSYAPDYVTYQTSFAGRVTTKPL